MRNRKFLILLVVTVAVILTASLISGVRAPKTTREKTLLFPAVETAINDIARIELRGFERSLEIRRKDDQWVIASSDDYPAIADKVRGLLIQFANFRVLAEKTRRPHLYHRLSVEDPEKKGSRAIVTTLYGDDGESLAALIIGREKTRDAVNPVPAFYGRIPGTETSLLIQGQPDVSAETRDWMDTALFHIVSERVQTVRIEHPGETAVLLERPDEGQPDFFLRNIPEGKKAQSLVILNRMGALLEDMASSEVRSLVGTDWPADTATASITTFDGLVVRVKLARLEDQPWAHFTFEQLTGGAYDTAEAAAHSQADALNGRHADWVYRIQDFKYVDLTKHLDDLVRDSR